MLIDILIIAALIAVSAFFSGSETALMAADQHKLRHLSETGDKKANLLLKILGKPSTLISTILIGNNITNIAISVLTASIFAKQFPQQAELISIAVLTPILLVFAEVAPKTLAAKTSIGFSKKVGRPISLLVFLLRPASKILDVISVVISKLLRVKDESGAISSEEFRSIVKHTEESGAFQEDTSELISAGVEFHDICVEDIMVHKSRAHAISTDATLDSVRELTKSTGHSRFPVYQNGDSSDVIGVVYSKDAFIAGDMSRPVSDIVRKSTFVLDTNTTRDLLNTIKQTGHHLIIVVDEYGAYKGVVTLEDAVEEIIGEIQDEHDNQEPNFSAEEDGSYLVSGDMHIRDFNKVAGTEFNSELTSTMAGLTIQLTGRLPEVGEEIPLNDTWVVTIVEREPQRLTKLRLRSRLVDQ